MTPTDLLALGEHPADIPRVLARLDPAALDETPDAGSGGPVSQTGDGS